jgi:hypothetical protein
MMAQRYYERSDDNLNGGIAGVTGTQILQVFYKVTKRAAATATLQGVNAGSIIQAGVNGFQLSRANNNPYAVSGYNAAAEL